MTTKIWAISDTHLSFANNRDQTRFGEKWLEHTKRIERSWRQQVSLHDIVLLPGDLSWAHSPRNVQPDIDWLAKLPGKKVLARGNHDFWWKKLDQVRSQILRHEMYAVQGTCLNLSGTLVCGTMGHIAPNDPYYQPHKYKSYQRELKWLKASLQQAQQMKSNGEPTILMMHYPPFTSDGRPTGFTEVIQEYRPDVCVYGHLHFEAEWAVAADGNLHGTLYQLVTCDYLDMAPKLIWPPTALPNQN